MIENGILNIDKPAGMTSHDVVSRLRRRLGIKRIGHTGTLDPLATGVLPVCIGKATRIIEYYDADMKTYHAEMKLGVESDTMDREGEVIRTADFSCLTEEEVLSKLEFFDGEVEQVPPIYSALKVAGKRLYEYAREGREVEIESRVVHLEGMKFTRIDLEEGFLEFDVTCSKGTYIRSIVSDLGRMLGCGGMMTALERRASGCFALDGAIGLEELLDMSDEEIEKRLIRCEDTLVNLGRIELAPQRVKAFLNGMSSRSTGFEIIDKEGRLCGYKVLSEGRFLGIGRIREGELVPVKVMG